MDAFALLKVVHILGATVLFGTGMGTAFQMWMAHLSGDVRAIAAVSRNVVLADWLFTTPAGVLQPVTGYAMVWLAGYDPTEPWLLAGLACYVLAGLCWLPVVGLQIRVARLARTALSHGTPLGPDYHRAMRWWFGLGWPAFTAMVLAVWLMVVRPPLW